MKRFIRWLQVLTGIHGLIVDDVFACAVWAIVIGVAVVAAGAVTILFLKGQG